MFDKRGLLPLPLVEHTELRSCASVELGLSLRSYSRKEASAALNSVSCKQNGTITGKDYWVWGGVKTGNV